MKKLILALLLLSSCDKLTANSAKPDPPIIMCDLIYTPEDPALMNKVITGYVQPPKDLELRDGYLTEVKIKLNGEVVYNSCREQSTPGMYVYASNSWISFNFNLMQNDEWREDYFAQGEQPVRSDISWVVETKPKCGFGSWRTLVSETNANIHWTSTGNDCSPPGYYGSVSVPLGN